LSWLDKIILINYIINRLKNHKEEDKFMEIKDFRNLGFLISKDRLLENLRADPRVVSAEYKDGKFHVISIRGKFSFKFTAVEGEGTA